MNNYQDVKDKVMDLLNQIVVLTKSVPTPPNNASSDYGDTYLTSEYVDFEDQDDLEDRKVDLNVFPDAKSLDNAVYVTCVSQYAKRVVDGDEETANRNEEKYYSSACW